MISSPSLCHLFCSIGKCWGKGKLKILENLLERFRVKRMGSVEVWDGDLGEFSSSGKGKQEYRDDLGSC